jgi:hypothetical protein
MESLPVTRLLFPSPMARQNGAPTGSAKLGPTAWNRSETEGSSALHSRERTRGLEIT